MRQVAHIRHRVTPLAIALLAAVALSGCGTATPQASQVEPTHCAGENCPEQVQAASVETPDSTPRANPGTPGGDWTRALTATPASTPYAPPEPAVTPQAFESDAAVLGPVIWATTIDADSRAPGATVTTFDAGTAAMYATVYVERVNAGTTISAQWTYNQTRLETFDSTLMAESAHPDGEGTWLEFHLTLNEAGTWPTGTYEIDILVNGEPAVHGSVEVVTPGG